MHFRKLFVSVLGVNLPKITGDDFDPVRTSDSCKKDRPTQKPGGAGITNIPIGLYYDKRSESPPGILT